MTDSSNCARVGGSDRDFQAKVTHLQERERGREERLHDKIAEELNWITKLCVALILGPHMLRCLYPSHP